VHDVHGFLVNVALVLCVAGATTALFQWLRQPVVLGYLLAGAIVSPHTPLPVFADEATTHTLSELGVILLMFSLGLEFSLAKLVRIGPTAGVVAVIQCSLMVWLGYESGQLFGWTTLESLYTGALIAISSTTIIVKAFAEQGVRGTLAELVFGVLIVEDLIAIFLLAVLTTLSSGEGLTAAGLLATSARLGAFLAIVVGGGLLIVPALIRGVLTLDRPETTVVTSVGLSFAFALLAWAAGYSVALGAFLGGALVAESGAGETVEHLVRPVRDIFAAIFFVAVGMLIEPAVVAEHWRAIAYVTGLVVVGKVIGVAIGVFLTGQPIRRALQAGMSLAQIGEFSFIIAGVGVASGATRGFLYPVAVAVSALTTLLTPWLIRASDPVATWVDRRLPKPIQTFAALYGTWIEQLRAQQAEPTLGRRVRRLIRFLLLDVACLVAVVVGAAVAGGRAIGLLGARLDVPARAGHTAVVVAAGVLALPFSVGIVRRAGTIARTLAAAALPRTPGRLDMADAPRRALVATFEIAILLLVGVPLVVVTQPFMPAVSGMTLLAVGLALLAFTLWRSATNLQEHARAGAQAIVEVLARQARSGSPDAAAQRDLDQMHRVLPGLGTPVPVRVPAGSGVVGRTLAELDLRGLTGATVLAIVRGDGGILVPTGHDTVLAGDLLAVAGTAEAVAAARTLLEQAG